MLKNAVFPLFILSVLADSAVAQRLADGNYIQTGSISSTLKCELAADGTFQETTKADYEASGNTAAVNSREVADDAEPTAEDRALLDDEDLDAYFEAFPDQAEHRCRALARRADSSSLTVRSRTPGSFKAKRQVDSHASAPSSNKTLAARATDSRQRNEFLSWPGAPAGTSWKYTWKTFQARGVSTGSHFFHAWQILRRDANGGPVVSLDYLNGQVVIGDTVAKCKQCAKLNGSFLKNWAGSVISHSLTVTYGPSGSISYSAFGPDDTSNPILTYSSTNRDMGSSASLKFGNYRKYTEGQTKATAYLGDFTQTQLS
ncbi:hypothetical protein JCM11641_001328 [Rhodosporidiobolus odoratus]